MSAERPQVRRAPVLAIAALAMGWIAVLVGLVLTSANPVVVNRVQVQYADVIVLGVWQSGSPAQLAVERTWKSPLKTGFVKIRALDEAHPTGRVIVPLTRISQDLYEVTHGEFANLPEHPPQKPDDVVKPAQVRQFVYPATDDAIRQIEALLSKRETR